MSNYIFASLLGLSMLAAPVFAGTAPYENATSKALQTQAVTRGQYVQPRVYVQPRIVAQQRMTVAPQVATAPQANQGRRTFSYEPASPPVDQGSREFSYEPIAPRYVAPSRSSGRNQHSYENATMKGLGQIR